MPKKLGLLSVFFVVACGLSYGAAFTPGNLVVVRSGTGATLTSAATAVFLDEYTTAGALVQSIAIPTVDAAGNRAFTISGTATSDGSLTVSTDGQYLIMAGYSAAPGTAGIATTTSAVANRVVARISPAGVIDTTTFMTAANAGGSNTRGAASDNGSNLWVGGATTAGTYFVPTFGAVNSTVNPLVAINTRVVKIFGGQLYYSTGSGTTGVYSAGSGLPTSGTQTVTLVAPSTSPYGFFFADMSPSEAGLDTLYIADDGGTVKKFSKVAGAWAQTGSVAFSGARGLTGSVSGATVTLFVSTGGSGATGGGTLARITDASGYNGALAGSATNLATAPANTAFRGVAFAPQSTGVSTNPSATGTATDVSAGSSTNFSGTLVAGTNPASTGLAVSCDLTAVGGSSTFVMTVAGANFSGTYAVPGATAPQNYSLPCIVSDTQIRSSSFTIVLKVAVPFNCETGVKTSTAIHTVQGSGATSPITGQSVEVEGIVVGSFQGAANLRGYYLQEPDATWDNNPLTSEGVFVFDNGVGPIVNVGDRVRVAGTVTEFTSSGSWLGATLTASLTEIGAITNSQVCSTGNSFTRSFVTLPAAAQGDLERYEGMAVQINQQLTVTGNFSLGTFGQVDLAPALLYTPTVVPDATVGKTAWTAAADLIARSAIQMDDGSNLSNTNLFPTIFPQGGLSAANTLRDGDTVQGIAGVMDNRFGAPRVLATAAVTFNHVNPRPAIAPVLTSVGGRFRAISANVLNFFTTFGKRGAADQNEFDHQKTKIIEALYGMNGDVFGLSEVQNFANGNTSGVTYTNLALQSLVDGLNCKFASLGPLCATPAGPFAFVDTLPLGTINGTDAIRSAIIYRTDRLLPTGGPAIYSQNDTNRPTIAQTFAPASGAKLNLQSFTFVVNHFRSKGSACGGGQDDAFQGNCNGLRLNMAQNVVSWLATNPTADPLGASRRQLLVGDFNAYFGEDPIQYFKNNGYPNLINLIIGTNAYSYNFGSQAGYLDHAIANAAMNGLVKSVAEWHNNADEPTSLQATQTSLQSAAAQAAYYAPDPYAASDHDPIVIGFNPLAGDFNDDGVVNTVDQLMVTSQVGKNASQVDRRLDLDGDGKITANDYRLWTALYRTFIQ
ncbi:MAG: ExeM/NucH family extracellular endonuclease [Candidatus Solibacter sp.]